MKETIWGNGTWQRFVTFFGLTMEEQRLCWEQLGQMRLEKHRATFATIIEAQQPEYQI